MIHLTWILVLSCCLLESSAFQISVSANSEECFFDQIATGAKVAGSYSVTSGGFLDIDVKVYDPQLKVIYEDIKSPEGSFVFMAVEEGMYQLCFGNRMSTVTAKTVSFNLYSGNPFSVQQGEVAKKGDLTTLEKSAIQLAEGFRSIKDEQVYMKAREQAHHATNASTHSRVLWWSVIQTLSLMGMSFWQIFHLRRFFETKRAF